MLIYRLTYVVLTTELICEGEAFRIEEIAAGRETDVHRFLDGLDPPTRKKGRALLEDAARFGPPQHNITQCRSLGDGLFELKGNQLRIIFFYEPGSRIVCTHAFIKKRNTETRAEIERARRLRAGYRGQ